MKKFILYLLTLIIGITIGVYFMIWSYKKDQIRQRGSLEDVMGLIRRFYVDDVNTDSLGKATIPYLLGQLDPHSAYIPKKIAQEEAERMQGSFAGIGIQFAQIDGKVIVTHVQPEGPSATAGLQPRDVIIKADSFDLTTSVEKNEDIKWNEFIRSKLKGKDGSTVNLTIKRGNKTLNVKITRAMIPIPSIAYSKIVYPGILCIRITSWTETTYAELLSAIQNYKQRNEGKLPSGIVIDLRGNPGGLISSVTNVTNEFLSKGEKIVSSKGKHSPPEMYEANGEGRLQNIPLAIIIGPESASASEIFAGAIQDNDRGSIIGLRSFGKGLVQRIFNFPDGAELRLTIAHYYTPSGRCIQRTFDGKDIGKYYNDEYYRYESGELFHKDSIHLKDSTKYYTRKKRIVYGGGGIIPDVYVPLDTVGVTTYYQKLRKSGAIGKFACTYFIEHPELSKITSPDAMIVYLSKKCLLWSLVRYAQAIGVEPRSRLINRSKDLILRDLFYQIAGCRFGYNHGSEVLCNGDRTLNQAIETLSGTQPNMIPW